MSRRSRTRRSSTALEVLTPTSGKALKTGAETFSDVFGKELTALAREDSRACARSRRRWSTGRG